MQHNTRCGWETEEVKSKEAGGRGRERAWENFDKVYFVVSGGYREVLRQAQHIRFRK
jgi:hypothetical protein